MQLNQPLHEVSQDKVKDMDLKYYNSDIHRSSFVLPQFAKEVVVCHYVIINYSACQQSGVPRLLASHEDKLMLPADFSKRH